MYVMQQQKDKVVRLWREEKSISEILKELGWSAKSGRNLMNILRENGEIIPLGLTGNQLHELTIKKIDEVYCIENLVFRGLGELDIQGMLLQQKVYPRSTQNVREFGTLRAYESRYAKVMKLQKQDRALIVLDGLRTEVEKLAAKIEEFYEEKGFEKINT